MFPNEDRPDRVAQTDVIARFWTHELRNTILTRREATVCAVAEDCLDAIEAGRSLAQLAPRLRSAISAMQVDNVAA